MQIDRHYTLPFPPSVNGLSPRMSVLSAPCTYMIVAWESQRYYVGSTCNMRQRWNQHMWALANNRHTNPHMQSVFNVYGKGDFVLQVLEVLPATERRTLESAEQKVLDACDFSSRRCMNVLQKAYSSRGRKVSLETRRRMSESAKRQTVSPSARVKMSEAKRGRKLSEEHKAKIGEASRGRPGPEHTSEAKWAWRGLDRNSLERLWSMRRNGESGPSIARSLGISKSVVYRILNGESYMGAINE